MDLFFNRKRQTRREVEIRMWDIVGISRSTGRLELGVWASLPLGVGPSWYSNRCCLFLFLSPFLS